MFVVQGRVRMYGADHLCGSPTLSWRVLIFLFFIQLDRLDEPGSLEKTGVPKMIHSSFLLNYRIEHED